MSTRKFPRSILWLGLLSCASAFAAESPDALEAGFRDPPNTARPRVWWHWIDGNVSEKGIRDDLNWLSSVGIGGVHNFDAALSGSGLANTSGTNDRVAYLTPRWRELFRLAVTEAQRHGMEFTIAASPGWSESGGPWVTPAAGMKKLVWSETLIAGGKPFRGALPQPPNVTGPFQDIPITAVPFAEERGSPQFYADVGAFAYRIPARFENSNEVPRSVTSSAGAMDAALLGDGSSAKAVLLPYGEGSTAWIQFDFGAARSFRSATVNVVRPAGGAPSDMATGSGVWIEASNDGKQFRRLAQVPRSGAPQQTVSLPVTSARYFRLTLQRPPPDNGGLAALLGLPVPPAPTAHQIFEFSLHAEPRVNRFEDKAGFSNREIIAADDTPEVQASDVTLPDGVVDLRSHLKADGVLDWTPPRGQWLVIRLGYSLTGRTNHPASREGTGLEVDKLNSRHVKNYFESYLAEYERTLGTDLIGASGLQNMLTDSYEAGIANWTDDMLDQFRIRRGYDPVPWLPVLAGRIVRSAVDSDRFLWDYRRTLADLIAEAHYDELSKLLRERGMGRYGESHESGRAFVGDGMETKKNATVPMGAIWSSTLGQPRTAFDADIRESASVAHIYGQGLVAAESFTAFGNTYAFTPRTLKPFADRALSMGLNRFVIHTSVHQPDDRPGPGFTLGPFGQWFTRHEVWAGQAKPWVDYLSRSSWLLQQGRFVADIAYLYGEGSNVTNLFGQGPPSVPAGYNFDYVNADALRSEFSVSDGLLATRSGMRYRLLALDPSTQRMSLPLLRKVRDLVKAGASVVGARPAMTPSLADDAVEFRRIADELWPAGQRAANAPGRVLSSSLDDAVNVTGLAPDCLLSAPPGEGELRFVHRTVQGAEMYFVSNASASSRTIDASFRVTGMDPELWNAETGEITPAGFRIAEGRTHVELNLPPDGAIFVVFRKATSATSRQVAQEWAREVGRVEGPWSLAFEAQRGAPDTLQMERLVPLTSRPEPGVRYFSGTATYVTNISIPGEWLSNGQRIRLDLGEVHDLADVTINGRNVGKLWNIPFRIDITEALHAGGNRLEVKVANTWPNRMIGDKQPGAPKVAYATFDPFKTDSPLLSSGLIGPVRLEQVRSDSRSSP